MLKTVNGQNVCNKSYYVAFSYMAPEFLYTIGVKLLGINCIPTIYW